MGGGQHPRVLVVLDGTEEPDVTVATLRVDSDVRRGEPSAEIVAAAHIHAVDMIAMLLHPRSRLERCFFDTVADEVVRQAAVPVLLLPPGQRHLTPQGQATNAAASGGCLEVTRE
jgi:nucleotide-binding universal stress UspA family protein